MTKETTILLIGVTLLAVGFIIQSNQGERILDLIKKKGGGITLILLGIILIGCFVYVQMN